jgi:hypothetical protein
MHISKKLRLVLGALAVSVLATPSYASSLTVIGTDSVGNQLIYDSALGVTWYDSANYFVPLNTLTTDGQNLSVTFNGVTITGWSLPTAVNNNFSGWNTSPTTADQLGYLYYVELANKGTNQPGYNPTNINVGPFLYLDVGFGDIYWTQTVDTLDGHSPHWGYSFGMTGGHEQPTNPTNYGVGLFEVSGFPFGTQEISQTPLPAALPLFATGLGALGLLGWRRKRKALAD